LPTYPLKRVNAWKAWSKGHVKGVNSYISSVFEDQPVVTEDARTGRPVTVYMRPRTLANQAIAQGMNSVRVWLNGWSSKFAIIESDWDAIAEDGLKAGANGTGWDSTRPLNYSFDPEFKTIADYTALITQLLDQCQKLGLGVIFTGTYYPHQHGGQDLSPWGNPGSAGRTNLAQFWVEVVKKWGNHPAIIGLDILNEPGPPVPAAGYSPAAWRNAPNGWCTLAQDVVDKIRAAEQALKVATPVPIVVEVTADARSITVFDPYTPGAGGSLIKDPAERIVYSFHHYSPHPVTHQGIFGDTWVNIGKVYGRSVARHATGGFSGPYGWYESLDSVWGPGKELVRDAQTLEDFWKDVINFQRNAAAAGKPVAIYVGEFGHIHPDVEQVEPADFNRTFLFDPANGVPTYRCVEGSERFFYPVFSPDHMTGGWKKQNPSRWVTRVEPFTGTDGQAKVRFYFDNLDRLLFGRTVFPRLKDSEMGGLLRGLQETINHEVLVIPPTPTPRPRAILEKICVRDAATGQLNLNLIDRNKVPLKYRNAVGFPIGVKDFEPGDDDPSSTGMSWPIEKFNNTLLMSLYGPEGEILKKVPVKITLDEFWVEVDASVIKVDAYKQAMALDTNMVDDRFPPKAVATFSMATPNAEMEAGRDQFVADTLAVCRRLGLSWAFLDNGGDSIGVMGWRASSKAMKLLKDDCES
jgi:Cellulase (glycosyl hydrolase family 5)